MQGGILVVTHAKACIDVTLKQLNEKVEGTINHVTHSHYHHLWSMMTSPPFHVACLSHYPSSTNKSTCSSALLTYLSVVRHHPAYSSITVLSHGLHLVIPPCWPSNTYILKSITPLFLSIYAAVVNIDLNPNTNRNSNTRWSNSREERKCQCFLPADIQFLEEFT